MSPTNPRRRFLFMASLGVLAAAGGGAAYLLGGASAKAAGVVFKSPTCGCCTEWTEHMAAAGFPLDVEHVADLGAIKQKHRVPYGMGSCHTAVIDGYVVEGHVPASQVRRLLDERPDAIGLAVPGMPIGSPGMEGPGARPYTVYALRADGTTAPFARIRP